MTTAVAAPFRFFSLQVSRTERLGPSLVRVTFAGDDLAYFLSDGCDQSLSLFLPHPGQAEPAVPHELGDGWWQGWRELPDDVRAVMRSYTLRGLRRDPDEIDIDFVLHEPAGPASRWASRAGAGDRVVLLGPAVADNRAIRFRPPEDADLVVVWGTRPPYRPPRRFLRRCPRVCVRGCGSKSNMPGMSRSWPPTPMPRSPGWCGTTRASRGPPWPSAPFVLPNSRPPKGRTCGSRASPVT